MSQARLGWDRLQPYELTEQSSSEMNKKGETTVWRILRSFSDDSLVGRTILSAKTSSSCTSSPATEAVSVESVATAEDVVENPFLLLLKRPKTLVSLSRDVLEGEWRERKREEEWEIGVGFGERRKEEVKRWCEDIAIMAIVFHYSVSRTLILDWKSSFLFCGGGKMVFGCKA